MEITEQEIKNIRSALNRSISCLNADSERMVNAGIWDDEDNAAHDETHDLIQKALNDLSHLSYER